MTASPPETDPPPQLEPWPDPAAVDDAYEARIQFNQRVQTEAETLRVRDAARERLAAEKAGVVDVPSPARLDQFLARPLPPITHRIAGLWPAGGRVLLAAQFKAGKTTLRDNTIRSLVDGDPFMGVHEVAPIDGTVTLLDFELDDHTLQRWLDEQGIRHPERVHVIPMKGRVSAFNILDEQLRGRWAKTLAEVGTAVLVVDCLRPILDALNLSEDKDAGRLLVALDALAREAGVHELLVVHHMGHGSERSRGDSRFRDWPDAEWKLVRDKDDEDPGLDDVHGARYLSAFGRDVDHPQTELTYDQATRHLTLGNAAPNRKDAAARRKADTARPGLLEAITTRPGMTTRALRDIGKKLGVGRYTDTDNLVQGLIDDGLVHMIPAGNAHLHYPGRDPRTALVSVESHRVPDTSDSSVSRVLYGTRQRSTPTTATSKGPDTGHDSGDRSHCDVCGDLLHHLLVDRGETRHPTCLEAS